MFQTYYRISFLGVKQLDVTLSNRLHIVRIGHYVEAQGLPYPSGQLSLLHVNMHTTSSSPAFGIKPSGLFAVRINLELRARELVGLLGWMISSVSRPLPTQYNAK
jgi:hypothetical protein